MISIKFNGKEKTWFRGRYFNILKKNKNIYMGVNFPLDGKFKDKSRPIQIALLNSYQLLRKIAYKIENLRFKPKIRIRKICANSETEVDNMLKPFDLDEKRSPDEIWSFSKKN